MGNNASRSMTYEQYYNALKHQNGGNLSHVNLNVDMNGINPYDVLGVDKNCSWDTLKSAYRRTAMLVHPDKGGSKQIFNLVTECFRKVAHDYKLRVEQKPHHVLKQEAQQYYADRPVSSKNMDQDFLKRFNQAFEENKLEDDADFGYGSMMVESSKKREDIEIPKIMKKYNKEKFNQVFEKEVPLSKEVVIYKEPEPLQLGKTLQYTELGGKVNDFSSSVEAGEKRNLQYTDYKKAYTTTRLVDPRAVKARAEYKSVEDYESARAKVIATGPTEEELQWREMQEKKLQLQEEERVRRLKERDSAIALHHARVNHLLR